MAGNIAFGRVWSGFHYRSDGHEGILLGEQIAILVLKDWIEHYPEPNSCFEFKGYLGNTIIIKPKTSYGKTLNPPSDNKNF